MFQVSQEMLSGREWEYSTRDLFKRLLFNFHVI